MSDAADLRATLNQTDMSAPAIQSSSRAMMRFYDKPGGTTTAVSEWRSVLQTASSTQYLPLLYVANEVLQTSKRNRGKKYLEAFSPILGSSLQYICGRDGSAVEKVRRTVKIWGDRRVFSMRYVMDVLQGLDAYRDGGSGVASSAAAATPSSPEASSTPNNNTPNKSPVSEQHNSDDDDDDDDMFGGGGGGAKMLDISIDATALSVAQKSKKSSLEFGASAAKRRRSSLGPNANNSTSSTAPVVKKTKALSGQNFLDLFQSINNLDERYKSSLGVIESIPSTLLDESNTDIDDLVGDELTDMYKKLCQSQRNVRRERRTLYSVAVQKRDCEKEAKRYVSWLKNLAKVDDDDIEFCNTLEKKLDMISVCHGKCSLVLLLFCCFMFCFLMSD